MSPDDDYFADDESYERLGKNLSESKRLRDVNRFNSKDIYDAVSASVLGQNVLVARVAKLIETKSIIRQRNKKGVLASVLISGLPGTGKTEFAKALCSAVYGNNDKNFLALHCNNYSPTRDDAADAFIGTDAVYSNSNKGLIPSFLEVHKEGVILFDEFEKAAGKGQTTITNAMLGLLAEGKIQSRHDKRSYDATDCIVVFTSNARAQEIGELAKRYAESHPARDKTAYEDVMSKSGIDMARLDKEVKALLLEDYFTPEFLDRVHCVTASMPLADETAARLVQIIIKDICKDSQIELVGLRGNQDFGEFLQKGAVKFADSGARQIRNWVEDQISDSLIDMIKGGHYKATPQLDEEGFIKLVARDKVDEDS